MQTYLLLFFATLTTVYAKSFKEDLDAEKMEQSTPIITVGVAVIVIIFVLLTILYNE